MKPELNVFGFEGNAKFYVIFTSVVLILKFRVNIELQIPFLSDTQHGEISVWK